MAIYIRDETAADEARIHDLTVLAFASMPYSDGKEAPIIAQLRLDGDLRISLVASNDGEIVGHIAFSPVQIGAEREAWFGLGPISVAPDRQHQGIGGALIEAGFARLQCFGAKGCVLIGDPIYYARFGFRNDERLTYQGLPREFVQYVSFSGQVPAGEIEYSPAFSGA